MDEITKTKLLGIATRLTNVMPLLRRIERAQICEDVMNAMRSQQGWVGTVTMSDQAPDGIIQIISRNGHISRMDMIGDRRISASALHSALTEANNLALAEHTFTVEMLDVIIGDERNGAAMSEDMLRMLGQIIESE